MITPYHDKSGCLLYFHVEYGRPHQLPPAGDETLWSVDGSEPRSAYEWHLLYPDDPQLRDAAIMSLLRLARNIAAKLSHRNGPELFSVGLLTITEHINAGRWRCVRVPNWTNLLRWRMRDYLRHENRRVAKAMTDGMDDNELGKKIREARDACDLPRDLDACEMLLASEDAAETDDIVATVLADPFTREVMVARADGQTIAEIAETHGVTTAKIQRIIKRVQATACAMKGIKPPEREPRAPGRGKRNRHPPKERYGRGAA